MSKHGKSAGRADLLKFDPNDVIIVGLDTDDGPEHYLCDKESNSTALVEATVLFTMVHGIISPVSAERDGDRVLVVAGRGRTRYLREANMRLTKEGSEPWLLPVVIKKGNEAVMMAIMTAENLHRRTISPFWRAQRAQVLLEKGKTREEVAANVGVDTAQLANILKLLGVSAKVQKAIERGQISPTAGSEMASLTKAEQDSRVDEIIATGVKPTVRDIQRKVRESKGKEAIETPKERIAKAIAALDKLDDDSTKDDLWGAIKRVRKALS